MHSTFVVDQGLLDAVRPKADAFTIWAKGPVRLKPSPFYMVLPRTYIINERLRQQREQATSRALLYIEQVQAVKPWAVFRVTDAGVVELDTGDVIQ